MTIWFFISKLSHKLFKTVFGTIHIKETWLLQMVLSKFLLKCDMSKNLSGKLFRGTILLASLFWHHMKQFSVSACERFWKQASLKVVTYKRWSLMRGGGLQEVLFIVIWLRNFWYFEEVVSNKRWSLIRGGCKGKFDCCNMIEYHYEWS